MAWQGNVEYFWYHKDMFQEAGIEGTPKTLNELLDACEKLKGGRDNTHISRKL